MVRFGINRVTQDNLALKFRPRMFVNVSLTLHLVPLIFHRMSENLFSSESLSSFLKNFSLSFKQIQTKMFSMNFPLIFLVNFNM